MNKRWTPGEDSSSPHQLAKRVVVENEYYDSSANVRSILVAFAVVFVFFGGVYLLNHFGKLTFDNVFIFAVFIFACISLWGSNNKDKIHEMLEFKEPIIKDPSKE